jgi:hypothetical protein
MTQRETELLEQSQSENVKTSIEATVALCKEILFPRGDYEKAEFLLLEKVGLQGSIFGYILELTLGEAYISMKEISRAKRFLEIAQSSEEETIRTKATELITFIDATEE